MAEENPASWLKVISSVLEAIGAKELLLRLAERKTYVLVVGSTGAGKTALGNALTTLEQQIIAVADRTEVVSKHKDRIAKNLIIRLDTPGEIAKISAQLDKIGDVVGKPRVGVIQVVSYGYHESDRHQAQKLADDRTALDAYTAQRRQLEIDYIRRFGAQYPFAGSIGWSMTACTKADLWWSQAHDVLEHYRDDEFQKASRELCLRPSTVRPFCSTVVPFMGLIPSDPMFGEENRRSIRTEFISALVQHLENQ